MKVKKDLKKFISENMIFKNYGGIRRLEVKEEAHNRLTLGEFRKAIKLHEAYNRKKRAYDSSLDLNYLVYPTLLPGKLVEMRNGNRYIIIHDILKQNLYSGGYLMLGMNESLDSIMFTEDLKPSLSYMKILGDEKKDDYIIDKVYSLSSVSPGLELLLGKEEMKYSMKLIWQRQ